MNKYVIVSWPESQMLFDQDGFKEHCSLINDYYFFNKYGPESYFVDESWLNEIKYGKFI